MAPLSSLHDLCWIKRGCEREPWDLCEIHITAFNQVFCYIVMGEYRTNLCISQRFCLDVYTVTFVFKIGDGTHIVLYGVGCMSYYTHYLLHF